ncbi:unnamed protein product [Oppiella nova]|uniref:Corticotropin-releasing factor domain-containing protein n=1 Tax=Oppiella nova TaxID=334625 RepID=A0A7R9LQD6_9ACAR|nr:unnamed protein product [Oppiella nova]CAG2165585.1 unnamed protein product [Oppiella nova]
MNKESIPEFENFPIIDSDLDGSDEDTQQKTDEWMQRTSSSILTKRGEGPQLSIVNPLDVLRQRLLLELARRKMKENQDQIQANAEILKKIGKRSVPLIPTTRQSIFTTNSIHRKYLSDTNKPLLDSNSHKSCNNCQKSKRKERSTVLNTN